MTRGVSTTSATASPPRTPMDCSVTERSIRRGRRTRHSGNPPTPVAVAAHPAGGQMIPSLAPSPSPGPDHSTQNTNPSLNHNPNPNPNPNPTEEQLEELLLNNLDLVYREAITRLVSLGYDDSTALRAVLCNGHCYGSMDVLSNIVHNAIAYLDGAAEITSSSAFSDLRHLQEYSLASMVSLLQQVRPHFTRADAMRCLVMSDLHAGDGSELVCRLHASAGSENDASLDCPTQFDLPPSMKSILKRKTSSFSAAGYHPSSNLLRQSISDISPSSSDQETSQDSDVVASILKGLESMSIRDAKVPEGVEDEKKEMILDLLRQIRELERQVKDRREWAQQKAVQAARKLSHDLSELKVLRMELEENQRAKKGEQMLEDSTMKRLSGMESAVKKASGQVDRANAAVWRVETENAEIRAEMEASKLSASESVEASLEVAKRAKKSLKRLLAMEKQREKLKEEVAGVRKKSAQLQQELDEILEAQKKIELKRREEIKAKEQAIAEAEEEHRAKEAADVSSRRNLEALRQKIETDVQRHEDDIKRLEEELSRLKASSGTKPLKEADAKTTIQMFDRPQGPSRTVNRSRRECLLCTKDEVSVVFLPCAHQVLCAACNDDHEKRAEARCPCCNVRIEQRIRVYGVNS